MLSIFKISTENDLEEVLKIRQKVFVEEQGVPAEDEYDGEDENSVHYLATMDGKAIGCARSRKTDKGIKLERFAVIKEHRNKGVGDKLVGTVLNELRNCPYLYLHAQTKAINLYKRQGFKVEGNAFFECDIEHYKMVFR